jgi:hypothetical protein
MLINIVVTLLAGELNPSCNETKKLRIINIIYLFFLFKNNMKSTRNVAVEEERREP